MILSYSKPEFKAAILECTKIHTIRKDAGNRWKPGMKIHQWMHSPRNPQKNPHQFGETVCSGVEEIRIRKTNTETESWPFPVQVSVFGPQGFAVLLPEDIDMLAANDGLTMQGFIDWFLSDTDEFRGKIIHWTGFRYVYGYELTPKEVEYDNNQKPSFK